MIRVWERVYGWCQGHFSADDHEARLSSWGIIRLIVDILNNLVLWSDDTVDKQHQGIRFRNKPHVQTHLHKGPPPCESICTDPVQMGLYE